MTLTPAQAHQDLHDRAWELQEQHGGIWGAHPDYPVEDWRYEVANDETRLGYWPWVINQTDTVVED